MADTNNVVRLKPAQPARQPKRQLSDALLRNLEPTGTERYFSDTTPGLRLRQTKAGKLIWEFQSKVPGRRAPIKLRIGEYPSTALSAARREARRLRAEIDSNRDPAAERQAAKAAQQAAEAHTFAKLVEEYRQLHMPTLRPKTAEDYRLILDRRLVPAWGRLQAAEIDRDKINALLDPMRQRGHQAMARLTFGMISSLLAFGADRGWLPENPCTRMKRPAAVKPRDRILSDMEIQLLWEATSGPGTFHAPVRLLLLTASRRSEIAGLRWAEIDFDAGVWRIPADRAKNGLAHEIDLHPLALSELARVERDGGATVFGQGDRPLFGWDYAKRRIDERMAHLAQERGLDVPPPWRLHDLRRSAASRLAALGVDPVTTEKLLNHTSSASNSLMATYQRYDRRAERREAIQRLGDHVARLVGKT